MSCIGRRSTARITIDSYRKMRMTPTASTKANSITKPNVRNGRTAATDSKNNFLFIPNRQNFLRHTTVVQTTLVPIIVLILLLLQGSSTTFMTVQAATYSVTLNAKDTDCYVFRVPKKPVTIRYDYVDLDFISLFNHIFTNRVLLTQFPLL